ncbi:MAG: hypothetical protein HY900_00240 [Deltaproteobacteria bacterium]|nr:hypothetical protein [Deltaproteobacteria bacterium]
MKTSMVSRDAKTFVALAQAVSLARTEGVLDAQTSVDLSAAFVAGILTGCMEMETYGRVHDALARLLEKAFETAPEPKGPSGSAEPPAGSEGPLGVYLEEVGEAWDKVSWDEEACGRLKGFARDSFDLKRARFGGPAWFTAPLRSTAEALLRKARAAGLLVVSIEGVFPGEGTWIVLRDPDPAPEAPRIVFGWGDRRIAMALAPAAPASV